MVYLPATPPGLFGLPSDPALRIQQVAVTTLFNSGLTITIPAPARTSQLLVLYTCDANTGPTEVTLSGWTFQVIAICGDGTNSQAVAVFLGDPDPTLPGTSGTSLVESGGNTFPSVVVLEVYSQTKIIGRTLKQTTSKPGSNATSVTVTMTPAILRPHWGLAATVFQSGGAGITAVTNPQGWLNASSGLGGLAIGPMVSGSVVFTSSRSSRWTTVNASLL